MIDCEAYPRMLEYQNSHTNNYVTADQRVGSVIENSQKQDHVAVLMVYSHTYMTVKQ